MKVTEKIAYHWANQVAKKITKKVQYSLEKQKNLTSGDDTCLQNNWEEYCMQVQYEESIAWDIYIEQIQLLMKQFFDELTIEEQMTLWLESEEGQDWYWIDNNSNNDEFQYSDAPIFFVDCVDMLMSELNTIAINFESENITNYVEYNCTKEIE